MQNSSSHIIEHLALDFSYSNLNQAKKSNEFLESVFFSKLSQCIETVLEEVLPGKVLLELDELSIDLGKITPFELENSLDELIQKALKQSLLGILSSKYASSIKSINRTGGRNFEFLLEAFFQFLQKGYFPSWLGNQLELMDLVNQLIEHEPESLKSIVLNLGASNENARKRIAYGMDNEQVEKLIRILEPVEGGWIISYKHHIRKVRLKEEKEETQINLTEKALNYFILNFILKNSGPKMNRVAFSQKMLEQIAAHYNLNFSTLLQRLEAAIETYADQSFVLKDLKEVVSLIKKNSINQEDVVKAETQVPDGWVELLDAYQLAYLTDLKGWDALSNASKLKYVISQHPDFLERLSETQLQQIISMLAGNQSDSWSFLLDSILLHPLKGIDFSVSKNQLIINGVRSYISMSTRINDESIRAWFGGLVQVSTNLSSGSYQVWDELVKIAQKVNLKNPEKILLAATLMPEEPQNHIQKPHQENRKQLEDLSNELLWKNYSTLIESYLTIGVLPTDHQDLSLSDLQQGMNLLVATNPAFVRSILSSYGTQSTAAKERLLGLLGTVDLDDLLKALSRSLPQMGSYFEELKSLFQGRSLSKEDQLKLVVSEFGELHKISSEQSMAKLKAGLTLINKIALSHSNRNPQNQFLWRRILEVINPQNVLDSKTFHLQLFLSLVPLSQVRNFRNYPKTFFAKDARLPFLSAVKFTARKDLAELQALFYPFLRDTASDVEVKEVLGAIISERINSSLRDLTDLVKKGEHSMVDSQKVRLEVRRIWTLIYETQLLNRGDQLIKGKISKALLEVFFTHLKPKEWQQLTTVFPNETRRFLESKKKSLELPPSSIIPQKRPLSFHEQVSDLLENRPFKKELANSLLRVHSFFLDFLSSNNTVPSHLEELMLGFLREGKELSEPISLDGYLDFFFKKVVNRLIWENKEVISQIYLKLKVEQSSQLDSRIKSHFLKHLESIQDAASVNKEAELFRWSETFGFLKERGFLPWWSPIKNLSVFLMEYITLVDHATDSQRKLLRYQLDSRTLESLLSKQGLIQRNTILLLLKNTKKLSQEIPDFQQLIASFDDPGNSKNELKRNLEIQKYSKDEEVKFHQTSKTNLLETLEVAGNEYLEPLREMLLKFGDRRVFESLFSDSRQKEYILTLLELAPFVYIKNVNPAKWRWLVYSFAWFQVRSGNSQIDSRYYLIFYHYLLKNFSGYPWKSILHQAYKQDSFKSRVAPELVMSIEQFLKVELMEENNSVDLKEGDQMFVKNAGLVLCWPFLTMLFTKLEWLENASFVSPEAQHRACHLLQYIAYGHTDFPEYELVLNKFLTGISPEEHLEAEIVLTEHEKSMGDAMLGGMKSNWEKMKNVSHDAVRETFLQREGSLEHGFSSLVLVVEKKSVDVLLDSIPWGISMVKLPWMKKGIEINWR